MENGSVENIWQDVQSKYPSEWLIVLELLELVDEEIESTLYPQIEAHLNTLKKQPELNKLIEDGLSLLDYNKESQNIPSRRERII